VFDLIDYIACNSPRAADTLLDRIEARTERLADFPYLGATHPEHRRTRYLVEGSYVIYYTVHRHEVVIRAVAHGARLFRPSWLRRED
jgi:plasmid stabilization system protein ParE